MKRNVLKEASTALRDKGYSYNLINQKLGVSKSTLSNWFKDRPFIPNKAVLKRIQYGPVKSGGKRHNARVAESQTLKKKGVAEVGHLSRRDIWFIGLGLYIGEGSKSHEIVRIINADPKVIRFAVRWFQECCGLTKENITVALHVYPDNDIEECIRFWQKTTGLSRKNFRKTQIDKRIDKRVIKKNKLPHGTAHVTIISGGDPNKGVRLHRLMAGWIAGVLGAD